MSGPGQDWVEKAIQRATEEPDPQPSEFQLKRGTRLVVEGITYKVIAVRPNGKVTLRREGTEWKEKK